MASSLGLQACAQGFLDGRGRSLPYGLKEGEQRVWWLPEPLRLDGQAVAYDRMQLSIPQGYAASAQPWPLLVFLHGSGERGMTLEDVKRNGPPMLMDKGVRYPMIVCSPQSDVDQRWETPRLHAMLLALQRRLAIDPRRVYVTGLSSGGSACWRWAIDYPNDLAAIAPMCGGCDSSKMGAVVNVPVRAYHGDVDPFVPLALQQACVTELQRRGGNASLTVYEGVGHDSWVRGYQDPELVPWLLAQTKAG